MRARGNTVFNGHLGTIDAGRGFVRLRELRRGDLLYVDTQGRRIAWIVDATERVPNDERSFSGPTDKVHFTLYTGDGRFDRRTRQCLHFRIVTARFVEATEWGERALSAAGRVGPSPVQLAKRSMRRSRQGCAWAAYPVMESGQCGTFRVGRAS